MFEIVTCMLHTQPTLHSSASLLSSLLIYYPSSILGANKLFAKYTYNHLVDCSQVLFALARNVLRPNYVINMTCKSDISTDLLLPITSPYRNDRALNSTCERLKHPQPLKSTGVSRLLTKLLEPSGYYMYHKFNIHNSTFCPHSVFMCFVWI
jgi:hypothetical protein